MASTSRHLWPREKLIPRFSIRDASREAAHHALKGCFVRFRERDDGPDLEQVLPEFCLKVKPSTGPQEPPDPAKPSTLNVGLDVAVQSASNLTFRSRKRTSRHFR